MRKIIIILTLFIKIGLSFGQAGYANIIYQDSTGNTVNKEEAVYTKIIKDYSIDKSSYQYVIYYQSKKIKEEGFCEDKDCVKKTGVAVTCYENGIKKDSVLFQNNQKLGKATYWYEDGELVEQGEYYIDNKENKYKIINFWKKDRTKTVDNGTGNYNLINEFCSIQGNYIDGKKQGIWKGKYFKNNNAYEENYKDGNLVFGESTDFDGTKYPYTILETKPEPIKGINHFYKYIGSNFKYTDQSIKLKVSGRIMISFIIDQEGKVVEPKIIKSLGYGLDEEAIRVLTSYPNWTPAMQKGKKVRCSYQIPIMLQYSN